MAGRVEQDLSMTRTGAQDPTPAEAAAKAPPPAETAWDAAVVGAGPVGLSTAITLRRFGLTVAILDSQTAPGGQCAELYPSERVADLPGWSDGVAEALVERLSAQALDAGAHFSPLAHVRGLSRSDAETDADPDAAFALEVAPQGEETRRRLRARAVVLATGAGAFTPQRLALPGAARFEGAAILYAVRHTGAFHGRDVVVLGGASRALEWALDLVGLARTVTLVHDQEAFRAPAALVADVRAAAATGALTLAVGAPAALLSEGETLSGLRLEPKLGDAPIDIRAERILCLTGLDIQPAPLAAWGVVPDLALRADIPVDPATCETTRAGLYAVGDAADYAGKQKLLVSGFDDARRAAAAIRARLDPAAPPIRGFEALARSLAARRRDHAA